MKKTILIALGTLLLTFSISSCKKKEISPEPLKIENNNNNTTPVITPTVPIITPTVAVNVNTITVKFDINTISGSGVPSYTGVYKLSLNVKKNGVYAPNLQPDAVTLNCTCNPRTIYLPGFKSGDTVTITYNCVLSGNTNSTGLPSVCYQFTQFNNNNAEGNSIYQSKQGIVTYTIQ